MTETITKNESEMMRYKEFLRKLMEEKNLDTSELDSPEVYASDELYWYAAQKYKQLIAVYLKENYSELWISSIRSVCSEKNADIWAGLIDMMLKGDPCILYEIMNNSLGLLLAWDEKTNGKEVLRTIEDFCKVNQLDTLISRYGMLFDSIYAEEIKKACLRGFKENSTMNYNYVKTYFAYSKLEEDNQLATIQKAK